MASSVRPVGRKDGNQRDEPALCPHDRSAHCTNHPPSRPPATWRRGHGRWRGFDGFGFPLAAHDGGTTPSASPTSGGTLTDDILQNFATDIEAALKTFSVPGAAAALVQGDQIVFSRSFGVGDLEDETPVTEGTRFRIASNTKSMTSMLAAAFVDDGLFGWNTPVVDIWPEFRAPTPDLTASLRIRDLLGMGTGIAESPTIEFFVSGGGESAVDALRSVQYLPVTAPPETEYSYNNTLIAVAGHLGAIAESGDIAGLEAAYATNLAERVFGPSGMADAAIVDNPSHLGGDNASGHTYDLFGTATTVPFVSLDGYAPAGSASVSVTDMARYIITQMNEGLSPEGERVVSAANLAETHRPGIRLSPEALNAFPSAMLLDTTEMHYCLAWFHQTFKDGRQLLRHAGGIDGFASLMGFFPEDRIGFVLLTNLEPDAGGALFNVSVQSSLLSHLYGLNRDAPDMLAEAVPILAGQKAEIASQTAPIDPAKIAPYLGLYSSGFRL